MLAIKSVLMGRKRKLSPTPGLATTSDEARGEPLDPLRDFCTLDDGRWYGHGPPCRRTANVDTVINELLNGCFVSLSLAVV